MYERILVPTDGSTGTAHVALQAIDLAEQYGGRIHAIHVVDDNMISILGDTAPDREAVRKRAENTVETIERMGEAHDVTVETEVRSGDPADVILAYADDIDADIIVTGTHGRSGVKRRLIGSVAERLVRHATCPVMTVRLPDTDVTVQDEATARELIEEAIAAEGVDATIDTVGQQLSVWVGEADSEAGRVVVYLDPETQRTSVIRPRGD